MRPDDRTRGTGTRPGGEMKRLLVLFLLGGGVAIVAMMAIWRADGAGDRELGKVVPQQRGSRDDPGRVPDAEIHPWRPDTTALNEEIDDQTERGRLEFNYPKALELLATAVRNRPHYHFKYDPEKADVGGYALIDPKELADPLKANEHRAVPVEVVGVLERKRAVSAHEFDLDPSEFPSLFEGVLRTRDGVRVKFLLLDVLDGDGADRKKITVPLKGTRYKAMGVFFRVQEEGESFKGPVILAKRLVEAVPLELRDELPDDIVERIEMTERGELSRRPHHELSFYDVVGWILKNEGDVFPEGVEPIELRGKEPRDSARDFRLKPVRVKGVLVWAQYESFEKPDMRPEDAPILGYWHLIISDTNPDEHVPVSVLLPQEEIPAEIDRWRKASEQERRQLSTPWIEVDAIYYRVHAYESRGDRKSPQEVHLPMVVAVGEPIVTMSRSGQGVDEVGFMLGFIGVGAGLVLVLVFMLARDKRKSRDLDSQIRRTRLERRKSRGMDLNRGQPAGEPDQSR